MKLKHVFKWTQLVKFILSRFSWHSSYSLMCTKEVLNSSLWWGLHQCKVFVSSTSICYYHSDAVHQCWKLMPITRFALNIQKSILLYSELQNSSGILLYYTTLVFKSSMDNGRDGGKSITFKYWTRKFFWLLIESTWDMWCFIAILVVCKPC